MHELPLAFIPMSSARAHLCASCVDGALRPGKREGKDQEMDPVALLGDDRNLRNKSQSSAKSSWSLAEVEKRITEVTAKLRASHVEYDS